MLVSIWQQRRIDIAIHEQITASVLMSLGQMRLSCVNGKKFPPQKSTFNFFWDENEQKMAKMRKIKFSFSLRDWKNEIDKWNAKREKLFLLFYLYLFDN